jgi:hypothetical protein
MIADAREGTVKRRITSCWKPMPNAAPEEINALQAQLERYHARHEPVYGPMDSCKQLTCVEVKNAIVWLKSSAEPAN